MNQTAMPPQGSVRDALAALLRLRGYTHDESDSDDYWYGPQLGVRPLLVCVEHEMNRDRAAQGARLTVPCPPASDREAEA